MALQILLWDDLFHAGEKFLAVSDFLFICELGLGAIYLVSYADHFDERLEQIL